MSKGNTFENDLLALIFNATPIQNIADNASVSPLQSLYVSLHTNDPGEGGNQATNEANYTNYARVAIDRTSSGWTVTGNSVSPAANISFPAGVSGDNQVVTHFAIGVTASGNGKVLYTGSLNPSVTVTDGVTPVITTATTITED